MTINEAIHTDLQAYSTLTAIVSTRIYEIKADPGNWDNFVVWMKVDDIRIHNNANLMVPIRNARFQFSCYSKDRFQTRTIASAINSRYKDYSGNLASGVLVPQSWVVDERDQGQEGDYFRVILDVIFRYKES